MDENGRIWVSSERMYCIPEKKHMEPPKSSICPGPYEWVPRSIYIVGLFHQPETKQSYGCICRIS